MRCSNPARTWKEGRFQELLLERSGVGDEWRSAMSGLGTRTKQLGAKRKCDVRCALQGKSFFHKGYTRTGVRKLLGTGLVLARVWRGEAGGVAPTERLK